MAIDEIIKQIQLIHPEFSKEQILKRLEDEKRKTGNLISDETLLRMIATELGVKIANSEALMPALLIRNLIPNLNDVTIIGRVIAVFSSKTFEGKKSGKFASLFAADRSGILRVILWNDKANFVESGDIRVGQVVRFSHGYTREDRRGCVELHIGDKSEVEVTSHDADVEEYPTIGKFTVKIKDLTDAYKNKRVNVVGNVKELFPVTFFTRHDSSSGKVMRLILADETGKISVVVWNEKVDEVKNILKQNAELQIVGARVKKSIGEGIEVHVDNDTYIGTFAPKERFLKIADLKEGLKNVNVKGEIISKPTIRDVRTSSGEIVKLGVFELKDETGRIWISAWRKKAEMVRELKLGEKVIVKNAYVKKGFGVQLELSTKNTTEITILN